MQTPSREGFERAASALRVLPQQISIPSDERFRPTARFPTFGGSPYRVLGNGVKVGHAASILR